jgi:hypothetical protein
MRSPAVKLAPPVEKYMAFPAPVGGWIANVNLATPGARRPDGTKVNGAAMLKNWFPTATGIRMRGGSQKYATIGDGTSDVVAMFSYLNGNVRKFFAVNEVGIYDITTVADPDVTPSVAVGSLTNDANGANFSVVQFATSGGTFLRVVNGANTSLVFDGTSWTTPAITGVTSSSLSYVWAFKQRLFFIQKDTLDAWYLAVDSISGAATKIPMGGVFTKGGSLLFGATWSLDTGSGLNENCVFVTDQGEVAVFQGNNPADAAAWSKVGIYHIGKPRGSRAFIRAGGDLVIATDIGFVALSQAFQRDVSALSPSAVSYPIEDAWNDAVKNQATAGWNCITWPEKQMTLVVPFFQPGEIGQMFAANARTGAWGLFEGWDGKSLHLFGSRCFYGSTEGMVIEMEVTGADMEVTYTATCVPLFDSMKSPASLKTGLMARAVLRAPAPVLARLSLQKDYNVVLPTAPDDISVLADDLWGTGKWGESTWGTEALKNTYKDWRPVNGSGNALSVATQITSGGVAPPDVDLVQTDLTYELGEVGS